MKKRRVRQRGREPAITELIGSLIRKRTSRYHAFLVRLEQLALKELDNGILFMHAFISVKSNPWQSRLKASMHDRTF